MEVTKNTANKFHPFNLTINVQTEEEASILSRFFHLTVTIPRACETKNEFTSSEILFLKNFMKRVKGVMESE